MKIKGIPEKLIICINRISIFPKLNVHLRTYFEKWNKNRRIKDAIVESKVGLETLQNLFQISHEFFNVNDSPDSPDNELVFSKETDKSIANSNVKMSKNSNINHWIIKNPITSSHRALTKLKYKSNSISWQLYDRST